MGMLLGFPIMDVVPHGLGVTHTADSFFVSAFGVHLPRMDLRRRAVRARQLKEWTSTGTYSDDMSVDSFCVLSDFARRQEPDERCPIAHYDVPELNLAPGDSAIIPVVWTGDVPEEDFYCETLPEAKLHSSPGIMEGSE